MDTRTTPVTNHLDRAGNATSDNAGDSCQMHWCKRAAPQFPIRPPGTTAATDASPHRPPLRSSSRRSGQPACVRDVCLVGGSRYQPMSSGCCGPMDHHATAAAQADRHAERDAATQERARFALALPGVPASAWGRCAAKVLVWPWLHAQSLSVVTAGARPLGRLAPRHGMMAATHVSNTRLNAWVKLMYTVTRHPHNPNLACLCLHTWHGCFRPRVRCLESFAVSAIVGNLSDSLLSSCPTFP